MMIKEQENRAIVPILTNEAMHGLIKFGMTADSVEERILVRTGGG